MTHITAINKFIAVAIAVTSISLGFVRASDAVTITNSVDDFSSTQGKAGWYYGYYALPGNSSSFIQMTLFDVNLWQESTARPPYTVLYPDGGHPSANNVSEHWAVRRWQSTIAGEATISGLLKALDEGETIGRIIINGTEIFSQSSTGTGSYELTQALNFGDNVDFAIDPNGVDYNDTTKFTATISTQAVPEPISILSSGLALGFGGFLKRKYSKSTC
jgi:hypothetical protein